VWIAFAVVIGNWGVLWSARLDPEWPALRVLGWLLSTSSLYAFCVFVLPEVGTSRPLDLKKFHESEGRRYILMHNIFVVAAIVLLVAVIGITPSQTLNLASALLALAFGIVALLTRGQPQFAASVAVAILATAFMATNINILTG
jgi:hypothetical protein